MGLEYLDLRETMDALGVTEDDLKELVASGRLRAYVDDNQTRFLRGDVDAARVVKKSLKVRTARKVRNPKTQALERPAAQPAGADGPLSEIFDPDSLTGESVFEDADLSREDEAEIARILSRTERPAAQPSKPISYEFKRKLKERSKQEILESGERDRPAPPRPKKGKKVSEPRHVTVRPEESRSEDDWLPPLRERGRKKDEGKERETGPKEAAKAGKAQQKEAGTGTRTGRKEKKKPALK
ncbi:MAG: hypothetical protein HY720_00760, partial [Planctomycetes bacterium]|nr:hypothetical protein [Planctomycetota bacterium]